MAHNGVEQVIHSFIHGSPDLKSLLLQHTEIIFECKVVFLVKLTLTAIVELSRALQAFEAFCKSQIRV